MTRTLTNVTEAKREKVERAKAEAATAAAKKAMYAPGRLPGSWDAAVERTTTMDIDIHSDNDEAAMTTDGEEERGSSDSDDHGSTEGTKKRKRNDDDEYLPPQSHDAVAENDDKTRASKRHHHEHEQLDAMFKVAKIAGPEQEEELEEIESGSVESELTQEAVR